MDKLLMLLLYGIEIAKIALQFQSVREKLEQAGKSPEDLDIVLNSIRDAVAELPPPESLPEPE